MRLLIVGLNYAPEAVGVGKYTTEAAEWLAARGHEVSVVTAPPHYPEWRIAEGYRGWWYQRRSERGVTVIRCPVWMPRRLSAIQRVLSTVSFALSSAFAQLWQIVRADIVLVIEPTFFSVPFAAALGALARRPVWLHVQDFELAAAQGSGYLRSAGPLVRAGLWLEAWLLRRLDRVSTLGPQMDAYLDRCGVQPQRRAIVPNWVDCSQIRPLERASSFRTCLGIDPDTVVALYSGTFGRKHGLELLVETARALRGLSSLRFVFCGNGSERRSLEQAALGLDNVIWLDLQPVEQLNELLNLADIHLLPQRPDVADAVLPSKLTGMLASGRPIVATAHAGSQVASIVAQAGAVTPPGDSAAFSRAVADLAAGSAARLQLGAEGRAYALAHLDRDPILRHFEAELTAMTVADGAALRP
jgi:colanic acid biosynthesis glycosyl transferase WcaI